MLSYRPATPNDSLVCIVLRGRTRQNPISVERLAAMGITVESFAGEIRSGLLAGYVCTDDHAIVGYCFGNQTSGEVVVLALLPEYEGRGIGRHLLELVVTQLSAATHKRLFLGCSRDPATRSYGFYRHLGWASTGTFDRAGDEILEFFPRSESAA